MLQLLSLTVLLTAGFFAAKAYMAYCAYKKCLHDKDQINGAYPKIQREQRN